MPPAAEYPWSVRRRIASRSAGTRLRNNGDMRRRWLVVGLAMLVVMVAAPVSARGARPVITIPEEPSSWRHRAELLMDHESLGPALREQGYRHAGNAEIYVAEIVPGTGQPALVMYDAGQGAFSQNFWPASSLKLLATVAALEYAGELGFSGGASISGSWIGGRTIRSIYEPALIRSDNRSYDLLVRIAGLDFLNQQFLPSHGLDSMTIGSDLSGLSVRVSPAYTLTERVPVGEAPITLPPYIVDFTRRESVGSRSSSRSYRSNNTDLFDLGEVVRRVMLHDQIPAEHRFSLSESDVEALAAALCISEPAHYRPGALAVWGADAEVCGKSGWWDRTPDEEEGEEAEVPPPSCTDVALITDPDTGRRLLLAATGGCGGGGLAALVQPAMWAIADLWGTPLQADAGLPIGVELAPGDGLLRVVIDTAAAGAIIRIDDGQPVVASRQEGRLEVALPMPDDGPHLLVVIGLTFGVQTAYRAVDFEVSG